MSEAGPTASPLRQARLLAANVRRAIGIAWRVERALTLRYVGAAVVTALLPVAMAWVGKEIVDAVVAAIEAPAHPTTPALKWVGVELALMLFAGAAGQYSGHIAQLLRTRLALHVDVLIFEKSLALSLRHFEDPAMLDVIERARKESSWRPLEMITHGLALFRSALTLSGYAALLFAFSPWAVLALALASLPFLAEVRFAAEQYRIRVARTRDERQAYYLQQLLTSDSQAKEIKLFALGPWLLARHRALHERFYREDRAFGARRATAITLSSALSLAVFYAIYVAIVAATATGTITLGAMTLYLTVFRQGQRDLQTAMISLARAYEDDLYMANLFTLLAIEEDDVAHEGPADLALAGDEPPPAIVFEGVGFAYPGSGREALADIDLTIAPGETVALVGPNGAGKTTLIKLLVGLYPLTRGRILVDGVDIQDMDRGALRAKIGLLFQDYARYHFTAGENIGLGWLPDMGDEARVREAADRAGAASVLAQLPLGASTQLGRWFGGEELSGGQWQRIALARAFMRRSRILILDEPTASLDAEGEHEVFRRFAELREGATALLITHRFSTVPMADRIVVLDGGRIVESGTHATLLAAGGLYARMWTLQAESYLAAGS